ncbi:MAG TPA: hypothetical protein VNI54_01950 [Thermoanaerobaculia bacterium]|nr:hypothetical protein [Thermoanaerobaculia bacterium]
MNGEVKLTARMLRAASFLPWLSAGLLIVSAAALLFGCGHWLAIVPGVIACVYGFRIALDAWLFEDILAGTLTTEELDAALLRVTPSAVEGPPPSHDAGDASTLRLRSGQATLGMTRSRPWPERCRGARRLIVKAAVATLLQLAALAFCAAVPARAIMPALTT